MVSVLGGESTFACDCSIPDASTSPIYVVEHDNPDVWTPRTASMGEMVQLWIQAWDSGAWAADLDRDIPIRTRLHLDAEGHHDPILDM